MSKGASIGFTMLQPMVEKLLNIEKKFIENSLE
jgi:hypothetical protein